MSPTRSGSGARLALGLLTVLPTGVREPADRRAARRAVGWFPLVGLLLAVVAAAAVKLVRAQFHTYSFQLLPALVGLALLAVLTRGLQLDSLMAVADELAALDPRRRSRRSAGVIVLVFVVLLEAAALERCIVFHRGSLALLVSVTAGRLAILVGCRRGVHSTHDGPDVGPDVGPVSLLAGSASWLVVGSAVAVTTVGAALAGRFDIDGGRDMLAAHAAIALLVALLITEGLRWLWTRRLGGPSRDVLLALGEVATLVVLVVLAAHGPAGVASL